MIAIKHVSHLSKEVSDIRDEIIREILLTGQDKHMLDWFGPNWEEQDYRCADLVYADGELIMFCASEYTHDGERIKVGCRTYQMYDSRSKFHSVHQRFLFPRYAEIARQEGIRYIWYTYHAFDKRHERYVQSHIRGLSHTDNKEMPLYREFKYDGVVDYKGVEQHSFVCDLYSFQT